MDDLIENLTEQNVKINDLIQKIFKKETKSKEKVSIKFLDGYSLIKSGIEKFDHPKIYLDTSSVGKYGIEDNTFSITYTERPSRANMQPIPNSIWFAKLKDSPKFLYVLDYMDDILNNYIFSTGFLGIKAYDSLVTNYLYALITSDEFEEQKNRLSIGATMQGINNDSFKEILVPNLSLSEMQLIGKNLSPLTHLIYKNNTYISKLKKLKKGYLDKFF
jgi:Restriction endonuclease S subunits